MGVMKVMGEDNKKSQGGIDGVRASTRILGSSGSMRPKCRCIKRKKRAGNNQENVFLESKISEQGRSK